MQSGLPLLPGFTSRLEDAAAAAIAQVGFAEAPEAARAEINRVIAEQTAGKITGLLPARAISDKTRLVLTSAIYLKAAWAKRFPEAATRDAPFYPDGPDRPSLTVPMMRGTAARAYRHSDGYQAVMLPYQGAGQAGDGRGAAGRAADGGAARDRRGRPARPSGRYVHVSGHAVHAEVPGGGRVRPGPGARGGSG